MDRWLMAGWLLGRVLTEDTGPQRPQEGLSFFDDVSAITRWDVCGGGRVGKGGSRCWAS